MMSADCICRFDIPDNKELFFSHGIRSRLVDYILRRKRYVEDQHDYYSFGTVIFINESMNQSMNQ